ncbi:MAG: hemerythrin domain-containing protein [Hoeflea sp.]|uniref:hemerythrin domain-containing protein n=1 Tax=Hoeflea sp. TaxID=1940281 RepID=UPI001DB16F6A|nr:hemerythrin domain-containing protein [Hoeflea sp.]MBU4530219.1 hemerythrin domain-containing protein [Alphaproteobacteria bacterium]MBU4542496.1 hemerythrin domain-containing protein [Alphaproteobacteria bacterium]MBU4551177.1 hemerythrin domain-containing protein [Alphaproteobacteria bacterium]MBV1723000.1 hemerythrin domain-containing protein [Hoeflea sp.]MBV1760011.1 hemerythrin domain-containing protein [Hoeflea sp.]
MNAQTEFRASHEEKEDLYYAVHKGLRLASARMLIALGQLDPFDRGAVSAALDRLSDFIVMGVSHLTHENREIHALLDQQLPGVADHAADDHEHHVEAFDELRQLASDLASAEGNDRPVRLRKLYQRFALFIADDFKHMHEEETEIQPRIEAHFSGAEITAIRERIVGGIAPEKMVLFTRAMLAAASRPERIAMVTGMQAGIPAEVFPGFMAAVVGEPWQVGDWDKMEAVLC